MNAAARTVSILSLVLLALSAAPAQAQEHEIGHRSETFVDPSRGNRSIPVEVYYPADTAGESVPLASAGGPFPVAVVGHGYQLSWSLYGYLRDALVPRGYVVALVDTENGLFPSHGDFGLDLAFTVNAMRDAGATPGSPYEGGIAGEAAVLGHSMGGGAALLAAAGDPTITAAAVLAPADTNPSAIDAAAAIQAPALIFAGELDCVTPPPDHQQPMYDNLGSACRTLVTVLGASHCQFAAYSFTCSLGEVFCESPDISRTAQQAAVTDHLALWLDWALLGDAGAWDAWQALLAGDTRVVFEQDCLAPAQPAASLGCVPESGALPLPVQFTVGLGHDAAGTRRVAARVSVALAGGAQFPVWRAGYSNIAAGESFTLSWVQQIPALGSCLGANVFTLTAEDVTPPPFNQPPYPPAGGTDIAACTVTGLQP